ncbi:MAG: 2-oxoacid:acceptor oxidoreductase subunit alpha [Candidatus Bathyarchaeota archaeon]|nr:MAG: 2-oxoacid:acceptor oxidoreductase subunit alpha [Candidatus Bathyarchaeota archaeon]
MILNQISVMIGGEAGAGIARSGFLFAKTCMRGGLHVFGTNDYQSLIRGGHNFYIVRADAEEIYSQADTIDLLLALNQETILLHRNELTHGGGIIYDGEEVELSEDEMGINNVRLYPVPLKSMVKELEARPIMRNTVALGAAIGLLNFDLKIFNGIIKDTFKEEIAKINIAAAKMGFDYACDFSRDQFIGDFEYHLKKTKGSRKKHLFIAGNEAVGLGAIQAGCKFYSAYPMTPATPILHFLAEHERDYGMIVIHAESEISAINMVAGASYAGVRAMTATSGGGFCLMTEGLGMTGMTETPVVIVLTQRTGPSTGLPTYTSQGDLRFAIHASQGEFPRVVIAPGDMEECFYKTMEAFNLAEKYQIPAIIITDKFLAESYSSVKSFDLNRIGIDRGLLSTQLEYAGKEAYQRHKLTGDGISLRIMPGTKGAIVRTNADEHDESGYTTEDPALTVEMADKRFKKLNALIKDLENYETTKFFGPKEAEVTILGWGSTKGPIREAMKLLNKEESRSNYLQILCLCPFPVANVQGVLDSAKLTVVVENNRTSQLSGLIRENLLRDVDHKILKYDGRQFNPQDLSQKIQEVL